MSDQEPPMKTPRKSILAAFCAYDKNKSGKYGSAMIETGDLVNVLRLLGRRPDSEEELQDMIRQMDEKGTGLIHFIDFYLQILRIDDDYETKRRKAEMERRDKERRKRELQVVEEEKSEEEENLKTEAQEDIQPDIEQLQRGVCETKRGRDMPSLD